MIGIEQILILWVSPVRFEFLYVIVTHVTWKGLRKPGPGLLPQRVVQEGWVGCKWSCMHHYSRWPKYIFLLLLQWVVTCCCLLASFLWHGDLRAVRRRPLQIFSVPPMHFPSHGLRFMCVVISASSPVPCALHHPSISSDFISSTTPSFLSFPSAAL